MHLDICVCLCICVCTRERRFMRVVCMGENVHVGTCVWVPAFTFHLLEARILAHTEYTRSASGQEASGHSSLLGEPPLLPQQDCDYACIILTWILGIQTQVLRLAWQALHSLSYFPSPPFFYLYCGCL